jgi:hypothetical protein
LKRFVYGGTMESMRDAWTDERLDDLNQRVAELSRRTDEGFREMRAEFAAARVEFAAVRQEIGAVQRLMIQLAGGIIAAQLAGFVALAAALS